MFIARPALAVSLTVGVSSNLTQSRCVRHAASLINDLTSCIQDRFLAGFILGSRVEFTMVCKLRRSQLQTRKLSETIQRKPRTGSRTFRSCIGEKWNRKLRGDSQHRLRDSVAFFSQGMVRLSRFFELHLMSRRREGISWEHRR